MTNPSCRCRVLKQKLTRGNRASVFVRYPESWYTSQKVATILNSYRQRLVTTKAFDARSLERELCEALNTDHRELKTFMNDLCKYPEHLHVAIYYMQHSNATGPVVEFQYALANAYGVRTYYSDECKAAQELFWSNFFDSQSSDL